MSRYVLSTGPDLSSHQGIVNIKEIRDAGYEWIGLRAGYGKNNIDQKYIVNAQACHNLDVKTLLYWFSYALNEDMSRNEADYAIDQAKKFWSRCPIAFDLEYDSVRYARTKGVNIDKELATKMAIAFLLRVKERGYVPVIYTNKDYLKNYFDINKIEAAVGEVYIWYARYGLAELPVAEVDIPDVWQYTSKGRIAGVNGNVDLNKFYTDISCYYNEDEEDKKPCCNINILNFQKAANADGYKDQNGKKLVEDGIDGPKTQYVRKNVFLKAKKRGVLWRAGSKGELVKWFQTRCNEILAHNQTVDGLYGSKSRKECMELQKKLALKKDGVAGYNTIQAVFYN